MLVFELRKDSSGGYFVRVVYNGRQISLPVLTPASNGLYALADLTAYASSSILLNLTACFPDYRRRYIASNLPPCAKSLASTTPFDAWAQQVQMRLQPHAAAAAD
jgi:hypothetical protein